MNYKSAVAIVFVMFTGVMATGCGDACADAADALEPCCSGLKENGKKTCEAQVKAFRDASDSGNCEDSGDTSPEDAADALCKADKALDP